MKKLGIIILALVALAALLQGCAALVAGGAGAGAVAYVKGEYRITYDAPLEKTWDATFQALKQMDITVYNSVKAGKEPRIEGTRKDGTNVRVAFETPSAEKTTVKIRVGKFGDEEASRAIDRRIYEELRR